MVHWESTWIDLLFLTFASGYLAGSFGIAAATGALFFLGEVPRVRRDILQQFPFLDRYFDRTIAPEDNVSSSCSQHWNLLWSQKLICSSPSKSSGGCTFHIVSGPPIGGDVRV